MSKVTQLARNGELDPVAMLQAIANGPKIKKICVFLIRDDETAEGWSSTRDKPILWQASHCFAEYAVKELVDEP